MPSHSLICPKVVNKCPVVGCGQNIRRESVKKHWEQQQYKHVNLLRRETTRMLWKAKRVSQPFLYVFLTISYSFDLQITVMGLIDLTMLPLM